jgi:hypothetical protein
MTETTTSVRSRKEKLPLDVEWELFFGNIYEGFNGKVVLIGGFLSFVGGLAIGLLTVDHTELYSMLSTAVIVVGFIITFLYAMKVADRDVADRHKYRTEFAKITATRLREKGWVITDDAAADLLQKYDASVTNEADEQEYIASTDLTTFKGDFTVEFILATDVTVKQRAAAREWAGNPDSVGAFNAGVGWASQNRL